MELKLLDVSKFYQTGKKSVKGVENVNLTFTTDSSFVVITGESGSGKTTLIKLLTGIENFDDGEIYFDDIPISTLSANKRQDIYTQNVSFVFQDYNLIEGFTAKENIMLALLKKGIEKKEASEKALEALDNLQIKDLYKKKISKLSGGEKQRVAIARALALESKVIIFDEPTGNLDKETSETLVNVIREKCKDKLVIYVTHEYSLVKDAATRHIVLQDGHVIEDKSFKKEKNDDTRVNDKEIKFSFKSLLYVAKLFSFKRIGRLIFSFLVLLGSALASFGISSLLANSFTRTVYTVSNPSGKFMQGNVINVNDKKEVSSDELSSNAYYDVNSLIYENRFSVLLKDSVDTLDESNKRIEDYAFTNCVNSYSPWSNINTALAKDLKLEYGSKSDDVNSIYLVVNESTLDNRYYRNVKSRLESAIDKEVVILPHFYNAYYYGDSYYNSKEEEINAAEELKSKYLLSYLKEAKVFKLAGVYVNHSSYIEDYIYIPSFNVLKEVGDQMSNKFSVRNIDLSSSDNNTIYLPPTSSSYKLDIYNDEGKYFVCKSQTALYTSNLISPDEIAKYNFNELNTIYMSDYWQNIELDIKIDNFVYKKSQLNNIRYISNDLLDNKYYYYMVGNPSANITLSQKNSGKLYYQSEQDAFDAFDKLKDKTDMFKFEPYIEYSVNMVELDSLDLMTSIVLAVSLLFALGAIFGGNALFRAIFNKLYFRKAADQYVLNYIGYKRKDIFYTNLIQFESMAIISNIIIYVLLLVGFFSYIVRLQFFVVPYLFITTLLFNLLFIVYLSIPFRHIGGGRRND